MEQPVLINTFVGGMNTDIDNELLKNDSYRYAKNIRLLTNKDGTGGMLLNTDYIRQYTTKLPKDELILGTATSRWFHNSKIQECGIIVTKNTKNPKIYNTIYVISDFDTINPSITKIAYGYLNIKNNVQIVTNYEGTDISKIYITDGEHPIKVINLQDKIDKEITDSKMFDIIPDSVLAPFRLVELVSGTLPACTIQYCYLLFNLYGNETTTSALSAKIPITSASSSLKTTNGSLNNTVTDRGCKLSATTYNDGRFNRLRVISILYLNSTDIPKIYIVSEVDIPSNKENGIIPFEYIDTGTGYIKELTIEEFNDLVPFEFTALTIEKKDNRLFAANTKEITWDIDYDARAYRANKKGIVKLDNSIDGPLIANLLDIVSGKVKVPKEHDCINPMNSIMLYPEEDDDNSYSFDTTSPEKRYGGAGINIGYRFVYITLTESELKTDGSVLPYNLELQSSKEVHTLFDVKDFGSNRVIRTVVNNASKINNYADPYFVSNFLGYQRDEVYRFGIIFYNEKNIPTPVHWIGDIRFPAADLVMYPFESSKEAELQSKPIGLLFDVKNIPDNVVSYEIVRCRRMVSDRTIVTLGLISKTINFRGWKGPKDYNAENSLGDIDRRPYIIPTFCKNPLFGEMKFIKNGLPTLLLVTQDPVDKAGVFELISADVCFDKKHNIVEKGMYIVPLYAANGLYGKPPEKLPLGGFKLVESSGVAVNKYKGINDWKGSHGSIFGLTYRNDKDQALVFVDGFKEDVDNGTFICAGLMKLYDFKTLENITSNHKHQRSIRLIEDAKIATNIPPNIAKGIEDVKNNHIDFIGNFAYTNWSIGSGHGPHGITTILYSPKMYDSTDDGFYYEGTYNTLSGCMGGSMIVNIKRRTSQYGGNTFGGRLNSIYISTGAYNMNKFKGYDNQLCFGGDIFLGVLDYADTLLYSLNSDDKGNVDRRFSLVYIPLESTVNVYYRSDRHFALETNPSGVPFEGGTANILYMTEPGQLSTSYVLNMPMYTYNSTYSNTNGSKKYIPKSMYAKDNMTNINRIIGSEVKTNNETRDSWTKFKFANYLDVDSKYGKITNLVNFDNSLYFFLDESVGIASVNERSLITDNNASKLVLGTGTVLSRYDYIVVTNGSSKINDKSITHSGTTLYWYDLDKNVLCALNTKQRSDLFIELSKAKAVLNYVNNISSENELDIISLYDKKYNEVWFKIGNESLIFNEQLNVFTSVYTHAPNGVFLLSDKTVTFKDSNMYYLHSIYKENSNIKEDRTAEVKFIVNDNMSITKVFDNVSFDADFKDKTDVISDIIFSTKTQIAEHVNQSNIENREDTYRLYIPREQGTKESDLIKDSYSGRMRGKYMICDYIFDCNDKEFKIPYIKTTYRQSNL